MLANHNQNESELNKKPLSPPRHPRNDEQREQFASNKRDLAVQLPIYGDFIKWGFESC